MPRNAPALPAQALPPDKRTPAPPPPFDATLPSGLAVTWRMPDPFAIVAFDGVVPDPITAATIALLREEKAYTPDADVRKLRYDAESIKGMYGLAGAMLETPRLDARIEYGANGTLGRREIGYMDVCHLYWLFRIGTRLPLAADADTDGPGGAADAPSTGSSVPPDARAADGD